MKGINLGKSRGPLLVPNANSSLFQAPKPKGAKVQEDVKEIDLDDLLGTCELSPKSVSKKPSQRTVVTTAGSS